MQGLKKDHNNCVFFKSIIIIITELRLICIDIRHILGDWFERLPQPHGRKNYRYCNQKDKSIFSVDIAGHVINIYVFLYIVALDNLFDNTRSISC